MAPLDGTQQRLDVLIALQHETLDAVRALLPEAPKPVPGDGERVELREPEAPDPKRTRRATKATRA